MKRYPSRYEGEGTAPGRCIRLLDQASPADGIVLDLGCGRAPLAEPVRERGLEYVGIDVDPGALAEVEGRGFEVHHVDLAADEAALHDALLRVAGGRRLAAVIAADLLEHLVEPQELLRAVRALVGAGDPLIVSVPNVTHLNIAAKLLLGRWDLTEWGLLDDTHLRFFSAALLDRLFAKSGWRQVAAADPENPDASDQLFPPDAPGLGNGTPLRELLRRLRYDSEAHGGTYQFVRRFVAAEGPPQAAFDWAINPPPPAELFATVLVAADVGDAAGERLRADLAAQTSASLEIVDVGPEADGWAAAIAAARGRYLCFACTGTRLSRDWIEAFERAGPDSMGQVLRAGAVGVPEARLQAPGDAAALIDSGRPLDVNPLDLLAYGRPGPAVLPAYAVPTGAVRPGGIGSEPVRWPAPGAVFLARAAELCGVRSLPATTVAVSLSGGETADGEAALDAVAEHMDLSPIILPPGSASRLVDLRRGLVDAHESLSWRLTKPLRLGRWLRRRR